MPLGSSHSIFTRKPSCASSLFCACAAPKNAVTHIAENKNKQSDRGKRFFMGFE
jgi:hypothetical protein